MSQKDLFEWCDLWSLAVRAKPWVRCELPEHEGPDDGFLGPDDPVFRLQLRHQVTGLEVWRFVACAAAARGQVEMLPLLGWMMQIASKETRDRFNTGHALSDAVSHGAAGMVGAAAELIALAGDPRRDVRKALAEGLAESDHPVAREALERLARDVDPAVRARARRSLGGERPWWSGLFDSDPERALASEEQRAAWTALRPLFDAAWLGALEGESLEASLRALPDPVARQVAVRLAERVGPFEVGPLLLRVAAERGASPDAIRRVVRAWGLASHAVEHALEKVRARATPEICLAIALAIVTELVAPVAPEERPYAVVLARRLSGALEEIWPEGADPEPLLAALLGGSVSGAAERAPPPAFALFALERRIDPAHPSIARHRDAIRAAAAAGLPGAFVRLPVRLVDAFVPERRLAARTRALAALGGDDRGEIDRAVRELVTDLHDPSVDPDRTSFRRALFAEPRTRASSLVAITGDDAAFVRDARRELRAGRLDALEAARVLRAFGKGRADFLDYVPAFERERRFASASAKRAKKRERPKLRAADWRAFFDARSKCDLAASTSSDLGEIAATIPASGPETDDDHALACLVAERFVETAHRDLAFPLVLLARRPRFAPVFVDLVRRAFAAEEPMQTELVAALSDLAAVWMIPEEAYELLLAR